VSATDTELGKNAHLTRVLSDVQRERERQDTKWGVQSHHPLEWLSVLSEEVGEVAEAVNEAHWHDADWEHYREELIQVAAVAVAAVEALDRNGNPA
jgi:NTP pyrophosphatase (non-canonical NTP hydrolase)